MAREQRGREEGGVEEKVGERGGGKENKRGSVLVSLSLSGVVFLLVFCASECDIWR